MHRIFLFFTLAFVAACEAPEAEGTSQKTSPKAAKIKSGGTLMGTVDYVNDGDTFTLKSGEVVRLVGINTPEVSGGYKTQEAGGNSASAWAKKALSGQNVRLELAAKPRDRYDRLLAQVYLADDGSWIQEQIIAEGLGHVYSFPDTADGHIPKLLEVEAQARENQKGLWKLSRWQTADANACCTQKHWRKKVGNFHVIEGTVRKTAFVRGNVYLNFGSDYKTDFTVHIPKQAYGNFTAKGIQSPKQYYHGKRLRVRGVVKPVDGYLITASHPEVLEILD